MRFFLRPDPKCDQRFAILITENSLPQLKVDKTVWHVGQLEDVVRMAIDWQAKKARNAVLDHPAIAWIKETNSKVTRFASTRHRVRFYESLSNPLTSQELLLGVSFLFEDRSRAMAFKLAWGNDASPDLIAYRSAPVARKPLALAA